MLRYLGYIKKLPDHLMGIFLFIIFGFILVIISPLRKTSRSGNRRMAMLSFVAISYDGRIQKAAIKAAEKGFNVDLVFPQDSHEEEKILKNLNPSVKLIRKGYAGSPNFFPYVFDYQIFKTLIKNNYRYIYCHDISTALLGLSLKLLKKTVVIVDFHEWLSENISLNFKNGEAVPHSFVKKRIYQLIEKLSLKHADELITVNKFIAHEINVFYKKECLWHIIHNQPHYLEPTKKDYSLRKIIGLENTSLKIVFYIGQIGLHRSIFETILAFRYIENAVLVLQGTIRSEVKESILLLLKENHLEGKVFLLPPVPPQEVVNVCQGADLGIFTTKILGKNFELTLPNKLFEYAGAGIPIIAENILPIQYLLKEFKIGLLINSSYPQDIADKINTLLEDIDLYELCKKECKRLINNSAKNDEYNFLQDL